MVGSFSFNNIESETFDLVCKSVKRPLLPSVKTSRVDMVGKSGVYDFDGCEYNIRTMTIKIQYIGTDYEELRTRARQIAAWLSTPNWVKLVMNDEPDKYYLAKITSEIDLDSLWESGKADISFDCQPFAYSITEKTTSQAVTSSGTIPVVNTGTRLIDFKSPYGSKFIIKAVGSWTKIAFSMNGKTITYNEAGSGELILNNVEMECKLGTTNKFGVLTGDIDHFLKLLPGTNQLSVGGTAVNATVSVIFIPMWI